MEFKADFHRTILSGYLLQVFSIRDAAANNLKRLAEEFGPEWAMQHIMPQVFLTLVGLNFTSFFDDSTTFHCYWFFNGRVFTY